MTKEEQLAHALAEAEARIWQLIQEKAAEVALLSRLSDFVWNADPSIMDAFIFIENIPRAQT